MKHLVWYAFILLFSTLPLFSQAGDTVKVAKVLGTDVIQLEDGTKIGLLGIATPQSRAITKQDCIDHLTNLIEGEMVVLVADTAVTDKQGKMLQRLIYLGSTLINERMIADGYAKPSNTKHSLQDAFKAAYNQAKASQLGAHATERSTSVQCSGITQKGSQCKRYTTNLSGKCWQHE